MRVVQEFYIAGLRYRIYESYWGGYCTKVSIDNVEQFLSIKERYLPTVSGCQIQILMYLESEGHH